jgi:hypothetical protein
MEEDHHSYCSDCNTKVIGCRCTTSVPVIPITRVIPARTARVIPARTARVVPAGAWATRAGAAGPATGPVPMALVAGLAVEPAVVVAAAPVPVITPPWIPPLARAPVILGERPRLTLGDGCRAQTDKP